MKISLSTGATRTLFLTLSLFLTFTSLAAPGTWSKQKTENVEYWMYQPEKTKRGGIKTTSLMINLHGCIQTADTLKEYGNWTSAAEKYGMTVVIPYVPGGGVVMGCWDYYGKNQNENNKFNAPLIALTTALLKDPSLRLDPARVFISGLSSGSGQAMVLGCLRPDLFHGVALNAGPVVGSEMMEIGQPRITAQTATQVCEEFAGSHAASFAEQKLSIIYDADDRMVNALHSQYALEVMTNLYGGNLKATKIDLNFLEGTNKKGEGFLYSEPGGKPRISALMNTGLGHAWPAGNSGGTDKTPPPRSYVNPESLNYPMYLGAFFSTP